jgi:hypothetical protein
MYIIKMKSFSVLLLVSCLFLGSGSFAQSQPSYQIPDNFRFDYEVIQVIASKKNTGDSSTIHFFYTKSGDYAAARISRKASMKGNLFVVITRDGMSVIFDENHKSITIISIRKLISDLAGITKWIRMDSLIANMRKNTDGKDFQSAKTGITKKIESYNSEEYSISDNKGRKGSVWLASVDFNTQADYLLGAMGGNILKMMSGRMTAHPLFQAMTQPKTLVTEINSADSTAGDKMNMHTLTISQTPTTVSTSGYQVNNYSNMTLPEIFQAEMKKRNN